MEGEKRKRSIEGKYIEQGEIYNQVKRTKEKGKGHWEAG